MLTGPSCFLWSFQRLVSCHLPYCQGALERIFADTGCCHELLIFVHFDFEAWWLLLIAGIWILIFNTAFITFILAFDQIEQQHIRISLVLCISVCFYGSDVKFVTLNLLPGSVCIFLPSDSSSDRLCMSFHMQGTVV